MGLRTARAEMSRALQNTNLASECRTLLNRGSKIIAISNLVGTEHKIKAIEPLLFELSPKINILQSWGCVKIDDFK